MDAAEGSGVNGGRNGNSADLVHELKKIKAEDEMELSLGLSTNGRFGVDPTREKLRRSTSLTNVVVADNSAGEGSNQEARAVAHAPLVRASSLPSKVETQERRRQMENLRNPVVVNGNGNPSGGNGLHVVQQEQDERHEKLHSLEARGPAVEANEEQNGNPINDMPYVSTRGSGPENRPINGFLYRYKRGEDVKILCVCHGLFLSPAEFVKHGGGGEVRNPLKHIVVTSFPLYN